MLTPAPVRQLGPLHVRVETAADATREIVSAVLDKRPLRVAFANTHLLYWALRDPTLADALCDFYVLNDGIGIELFARAKCGQGFAANLNGTDLTPRILAALPWGTRVLMVGAKPSVIDRAADRASRLWPHLDICAHHDGYAGQDQALDTITALQPDIVLVGMGNPLQEHWVERAVAHGPNTVFVGVGALFDFIAGAVPRAPELMRRFRLEWAFRLSQEPERLWRRYTVEIAFVAAKLLRNDAERVH